MLSSKGEVRKHIRWQDTASGGCRTASSGWLSDAPLDEGPGDVTSMVAGTHRPQARGLSVSAWIAAESGCNRTRTMPNSSGPGYWPFVGILSVSNHSSMRWFFARRSTARRPTRVDLDDRVGDGPDRRSSLHSLNRKAMTFFQPVSSRQGGCTSACSACLPRRVNRWGRGYDLVRPTDTPSGKTRFARYSLVCEFWYVSLNRATRKVISQCRPLRAYSQPWSARPQLRSYNTRCGIENVTTNPDFAGTSAHGIPNCCGLAPWPLKMDRAQIIGGSCSKARKAAPPLPGKIDLHRHQEVLPCHCGERPG